MIRTPACAPRPAAVVMEIGVASPKAQGQAMISTDTAEATAKTSEGSGPKKNQVRNDPIAIRTTNGTKIDDTVSATPTPGRWMHFQR